MKLYQTVSAKPPKALITLSLTLSIFVAAIDYLTGWEVSFSLFYLIPISISAWFVGRRVGILFSFVCAAFWLQADLRSGATYSHASIPLWNAVVRLGFFLIVTFILSSLRVAKRRQEELVRFVIHDLRSPLSNVIAGLGLIRQSIEEDGRTDNDILEICEISSERLMTLINSILDLSRLEDGKMPIELAEIPSRELLESAAAQVQVLARNSEVTVAIDPESEAAILSADKGLCVRILVNLLSNAIRFTPAGKSVLLACRAGSNGFVTFEVRDQGRGIPSSVLNKVFDPFFQVESHKVWGTVGTGLGLTFVKLAVEAQKGKVWLESAVDKGTSIYLSLPRA